MQFFSEQVGKGLKNSADDITPKARRKQYQPELTEANSNMVRL